MDEPIQNTPDEATIMSRCQHILSHLVEAAVLGSWALQLQLYILTDDTSSSSEVHPSILLTDYDGATHFDGPKNGSASHVGLRLKCKDGRPYKEGAIIGTFLHELAHTLDGYKCSGKLAHGPLQFSRKDSYRFTTWSGKPDLPSLYHWWIRNEHGAQKKGNYCSCI